MSSPTERSATRRLFVAIPLPPADAQALDAVRTANADVANVRWTPVENLHLTACFLGDRAAEEVADIVGRLRDPASWAAPFTLVYDEVCLAPTARRARMIWARYRDCEAFAALVYGLRRLLDAGDDHGRTPIAHVTVARLRRPSAGRHLRLPSDGLLPPLAIDGYELWESTLMPAGAVYERLERVAF